MIENGNQFLSVRASHAQIRKLLLLRQPSPTLRMHSACETDEFGVFTV